MMKKLLFFLFVFCFPFLGQAQYTAHYTPAAGYAGAMNVLGPVVLDDVALTSTAYEIGAFCAGECRGSAFLEDMGAGFWSLQTIWGNPGEVIYFKLYDHVANEEFAFASQTTVTFETNATIGFDNPYAIYFNTTSSSPLATLPESLNMGHRPAGGWMRPYSFTLVSSADGVVVNSLTLTGPGSTALSIDFMGTTFPFTLDSGESRTFSLLWGSQPASAGCSLRVSHQLGNQAMTKDIDLVCDLYSPAEGDVWESAAAVTTFPFSQTVNTSSLPLYNNYLLPTDSVADGNDAVYSLTVDHDVLVSARVSTGENGKVALYSADFMGVGGPDEYNSIGTAMPFEAQVGNGSSTFSYAPFYTLYNYSIAEMLFRADELEAAGVGRSPITSLSWYATNATGYRQQGISLWMANVSDTTPTTTSHTVDGMTLVYTGSITPEVGWNEFVFNEHPFLWDGHSHVLILCQRNNGEWNSTVYWQSHQTDFTSTSYRYQDSGPYDVTAPNAVNTAQSRPNTLFKAETRYNITPTTTIDSLFLTPGTYYLAASSTSESFTASIDTLTPPCPQRAEIRFPADSAMGVAERGVRLQWSNADYTSQQSLYFGSDPQHLDTLLDWTGTLSSYIDLTQPLQKHTTYYWQVAGRNAGCPGGTPSDLWSFTTELNAPTGLSSEENHALLEGEQVHLYWHEPLPVGGAMRYNVYRYRSATGNYDSIGTTTDTSFVVTNIVSENPGGSDDRFAVVAVYPQGLSEFSNVHQVTIYGVDTIGGHVYERDSVTAIGGATVKIAIGGRSFQYTADANGVFGGTLAAASYPSSAVKALAEGYDSTYFDSTLVIAPGTADTNINFYLEEQRPSVGQVTARYSGGNYEQEDDSVEVSWAMPVQTATPGHELQYYRVYRTEATNNGPYNELNTTVVADSVTTLRVFDTHFQQQPAGMYKYGIGCIYAGIGSSQPEAPAVFCERESEVVWSAPLERCAAVTNLYVSTTGWAVWNGGLGERAAGSLTLLTLTSDAGDTLYEGTVGGNYHQLPTEQLEDSMVYHLAAKEIYSGDSSATVACTWLYHPCDSLMGFDTLAAEMTSNGALLTWRFAQTDSISNVYYNEVSLFNPYVTDSGAMANGADASWIYGEQSTFGLNVNYANMNNYWVGEPFILEENTLINEIEVYAYQTGSSTTSTFTSLRVMIYDGHPSTGNVVWGTSSDNLMTSTHFTGCYRGDGSTTGYTRPIMAITASDLDIPLAAGNYYIIWSLEGTGSSGPWAAPHAEPGMGNTGASIQSVDGVWQGVYDGGTGDSYGLAYRLSGRETGFSDIYPEAVAIFRDGELIDTVGCRMTEVVTYMDSLVRGEHHYQLRAIYAGPRKMPSYNYGLSMSCLDTAVHYADLTISADPVTGGSVALLDSSDVTLLGEGSFRALQGTQLVAEATPNTGYHLESWSTVGGQQSVNGIYYDTLVLDSATHLVAHFERNQYEVTVAVNDIYSGSAEIIYQGDTATSFLVYHDSLCVLKASVVSDDFIFLGWEKDGNVVFTDSVVSLSVTEAGHYVAYFQYRPVENFYVSHTGWATWENPHEGEGVYTIVQVKNLAGTIVAIDVAKDDYLQITTDNLTDSTLYKAQVYVVDGSSVGFFQSPKRSYQWYYVSCEHYEGVEQLVGEVTPQGVSLNWADTAAVYLFRDGKFLTSLTGNSYLDSLGDYSHSYDVRRVYGGAGLLPMNNDSLSMSCQNKAPVYVDIALGVEPAAYGSVEFVYPDTTGHLVIDSSCTVRASVEEDYMLRYWTLDGDPVSTDTLYTFGVAKGGNLVAHLGYRPATDLYASRTGWAMWNNPHGQAGNSTFAGTVVSVKSLDGQAITTDTLAPVALFSPQYQLPTALLADSTTYLLSVTLFDTAGRGIESTMQWYYVACEHLAGIDTVVGDVTHQGIVLTWDYPLPLSGSAAPGQWGFFNPFVTDSAAMFDGADASWTKGAQTTMGQYINHEENYWVGDAFTLNAPTAIHEIEVYGYETFSDTLSTLAGLYVQIYNGNPMEGGTVVWGDTDANILSSTSFTHCYRGEDTTSMVTSRPIMSATASGLNVELPAGSYYLVWSLSGMGFSGPWAVPHAEPVIGNTGAGVQRSSAGWQSLNNGALTYGCAFRLEGTHALAPVTTPVAAAIFRDGEFYDTTSAATYIDAPGTGAHSYEVRVVYGGDTLCPFGNAYLSMSCAQPVTLHCLVRTAVEPVLTDPESVGSTTGDGNYVYGDTVTLQAFQENCYHFTGWTQGSNTVSTEATYSFVVREPGNYVAHFVRNDTLRGDTTAVVCDSFSWYGTDYLTTPTVNPTRSFFTEQGCDTLTTLLLTVNHKNTGDTTAVECDLFSWYEHTGMTASVDTLKHLFVGANQWGCDSTVTLHLTVNYQNTGDTTAVECDSFDWYEHGNMTATQEVTHLFAGANEWGCDSTVTLHLMVKYHSNSDTNAVACDNFSWYEYNNMTATQDVDHIFVGANAVGCDSIRTLHLTVNYQNTEDTMVTACDSYSWYQYTDMTTSQEVSRYLPGANRWGCDSTITLHLTVNYSNTGDTTVTACNQFRWWNRNYTTSTESPQHVYTNSVGCDSTVTLHLTVNYSNTGDTNAVACDQFSWYQYTDMTTSRNVTHLFAGANQWGCDSTVTLHLTIHHQNTGDTNAVEYSPFTWYEHIGLDHTQNVTHLFAGANRWGCDSTVTLHLKYPLYEAVWAGDTVVTYNSLPQDGLSASYVDDEGATLGTVLTFTRGSEVIVAPDYPVLAGTYSVEARPMATAPLDSLVMATHTLTILPATVTVSDVSVQQVKFEDGNRIAAIIDAGVLNGIQGDDDLSHTAAATYAQSAPGEEIDITVSYTLTGTTAGNYLLNPASEVLHTGVILENFIPDTSETAHGIETDAYGYCAGTGAIVYHLESGHADQYRLVYADAAFTDVDWSYIATPGSIDIEVPQGVAMGNYSATLYLRDHRYPEFVSNPIPVTFHVNLPDSYIKPLFYDLMALIDTCHCLTDVQWYHRADAVSDWTLIPGANDYFYHEEGGLTGQYRVSAKMNGVPTFTCPQEDNHTLLRSDATSSLKASPNPTTGITTVRLQDFETSSQRHLMRVLSVNGVEMERREFDGDSTVLDLSHYPQGQYMVCVDGVVVKVIKN